MRELYRGKGTYVRLPSVKYAIDQILEVKNRYGFKWVQINDDTINYNKKWAMDFFDKFKEEVNVPYICNIRIDTLDKELTLKMIETGIDRANFGIEHGNPQFREEILHRKMSNEHIIEMAQIFRNNNIRMSTSNIVGFPGETLDLAYETVYLNQKIKPEMAVAFIMTPYPKTDIYKYCLEKNLLKENVTIDTIPAPITYYFDAEKKAYSVVKLENENEIVNMQKFFYYLVKYPMSESFLRLLMKFPPNRLYDIFSQIPIIKKKIKYSKDSSEILFHLKGLFSLFYK